VRELLGLAHTDDSSLSLPYARVFLPSLLPPCVKRVLFLDSDVVVLGAVEKLWAHQLGGQPLATPLFCEPSTRLSTFFTPSFWNQRRLSGGVWRLRDACSFDAGVMLMDLHAWRRQRVTADVERWLSLQRDSPGDVLWQPGVLPPLLLALASRVHAIAPVRACQVLGFGF
jgi:lipopolysaccharide biosynthesis glycosyltransferase